MIDFKPKMLIESRNIIGTKIASELSETGIYAVTCQSFSREILRKSNALLIDTTTKDMDEALETLILSEKSCSRIFVLTSETEPMIFEKSGVLFISETLGTESICELIRYCLNNRNTQKQAEKYISKMLLYIGFQPNLRGYRYLIESVLLIVENPELAYNFNQKLYLIIAGMHNVMPLSVERSIRHAIDLAYDRNYQNFKEFFGYSIPKPTNTEFITFCSEKVRIELF